MEHQPQIVKPELSIEDLPENVEAVAGSIFKSLTEEYYLVFEAQSISGHSVIFLINEENPLTLETFTIIANEFGTNGVNITFNQDEQTVLVTPMKN